jgi:hypothetical protein
MSAGTRLRIILAAEGPSDVRRLRVLIDHFLRRQVGAASSQEEAFYFEGLPGDTYVKIKDIPTLVRERGLDRRFSPGGPNKGDGGTLRKLYQVFKKEKLLHPGDVVLWARDDDGDPARRDDAEAARKALTTVETLLFAIASECGEAWVIAGWKPVTRADEIKRSAWRQKLGFDPHLKPDELSHKENVPRSAKTILEDLFEHDEEQEASALTSAAESGAKASVACGLHAFCEEVEQWLSRVSESPA